MAALEQGEHLVLDDYFIKRHDVEFGPRLSTRVDALAGVIEKSNTLKDVILAQVAHPILNLDWLLELNWDFEISIRVKCITEHLH